MTCKTKDTKILYIKDDAVSSSMTLLEGKNRRQFEGEEVHERIIFNRIKEDGVHHG